MKGALRWLWIAVLISSVAGWTLPFVVERQGEEWSNVWEQRSGLLSSLDKRFIQLNTDQPSWVRLSSDFPRHYWRDKLRINRPVYPASVSLLCRLGQGIMGFPHISRAVLAGPCSIWLTFGAALCLNWMVLISSVFGFYRLLRRWEYTERVALISAAQLALSPLVLWSLSVASPDLVAMGIVVASLWLFTLCGENSTTFGRLSWYGLGLGTLMLAKAQYDVLFTGWIALACSRRGRAVLISFIAHLVPLIVWLGLLKWWGLPYYNHEVEVYGEGVWIWREFVVWPLQKQLAHIFSYALRYARSVFAAFGPLTLVVAAVGWWKHVRYQTLRWLGTMLLVLGVNGAFLFAIRRPRPYLVALTFYLVYPLAARGIDALIDRFHLPVRATMIACLFLATAVAWWASVPENVQARQHW